MIRKTSVVEIRVRRYGDTYVARAGKGAESTAASSTNAAYYAARAAAQKFFGMKPDQVPLLAAIEGDLQHGTLFKASKGGAS